MGAAIDHVGMPASDPKVSGSFLAWALGEGEVVPDGPPDEESGAMFSLLLDGWSLAFVRVPRPSAQHLAIRLEPKSFNDAVGRLRERGIAFGNDPEDTSNGLVEDPLGGEGRAYFRDPDGHLYELVAVTT